MKDYSAMSDFEINLLVNRSLGLKHYPNEEKKVIEVFGEIVIFDPCNNPADAWPIILENKINIDHRSGFKNPMAKSCTDNSLYATHHNVLRAAMTVYLQMMEGKL